MPLTSPPRSRPKAVTSPSHTPSGHHFPPAAPSPSPFPLARSSRTPFSPLPCLTPHAPPPIMPCVEGPPQATFNTTPRVDYASHRAPRQTTTPIVPCAAVTHLSLHFPSCPAQTPFAPQSVFAIVVFPHQHLFPTKIFFFFFPTWCIKYQVSLLLGEPKPPVFLVLKSHLFPYSTT